MNRTAAVAARAALAAAAQAPPPNPYEIERSWPPYFLEHQRLMTLLGYLDRTPPNFGMHTR